MLNPIDKKAEIALIVALLRFMPCKPKHAFRKPFNLEEPFKGTLSRSPLREPCAKSAQIMILAGLALTERDFSYKDPVGSSLDVYVYVIFWGFWTRFGFDRSRRSRVQAFSVQGAVVSGLRGLTIRLWVLRRSLGCLSFLLESGRILLGSQY